MGLFGKNKAGAHTTGGEEINNNSSEGAGQTSPGPNDQHLHVEGSPQLVPVESRPRSWSKFSWMSGRQRDASPSPLQRPTQSKTQPPEASPPAMYLGSAAKSVARPAVINRSRPSAPTMGVGVSEPRSGSTTQRRKNRETSQERTLDNGSANVSSSTSSELPSGALESAQITESPDSTTTSTAGGANDRSTEPTSNATGGTSVDLNPRGSPVGKTCGTATAKQAEPQISGKKTKSQAVGAAAPPTRELQPSSTDNDLLECCRPVGSERRKLGGTPKEPKSRRAVSSSAAPSSAAAQGLTKKTDLSKPVKAVVDVESPEQNKSPATVASTPKDVRKDVDEDVDPPEFQESRSLAEKQLAAESSLEDCAESRVPKAMSDEIEEHAIIEGGPNAPPPMSLCNPFLSVVRRASATTSSGPHSPLSGIHSDAAKKGLNRRATFNLSEAEFTSDSIRERKKSNGEELGAGNDTYGHGGGLQVACAGFGTEGESELRQALALRKRVSMLHERSFEGGLLKKGVIDMCDD